MNKIKVVGTIVNTDRALIGLTLTGSEADFGGVGDTPVERNFHIGELVKMQFRNRQLAITDKGILEGTNFRLNSLPMKVLVNNNLIAIDNGIALVGRFEQNGKNIGYTVKYSDNTKENLTINALVARSKWFKPTNFSVRSQGMGRGYIAGTNGLVIANLPVTVVGDSKSNGKKAASNSVKTGSMGSGIKTTSTNAGSGYDILDIFDLTDKLNGQIIKFANDKYIPLNTNVAGTPDEFNDYHFGEVAEPRISFNASKLNANGNFKKVGYVPVSINGSNKRITTFVHRTKSIFAYGENNMRTLGIAVGKSKRDEVIKVLGASLSINEVNDPATTNCLNAIIDIGEDLTIFNVNVSNLELISEAKRANSLLPADKLALLCEQRFSYKLISKFLSPRSEFIKDLKNKIGDAVAASAVSKKLAAEFVGYSDEVLQQFKDLGFDIYSGAYIKVSENSTSTSSKKSEDDKLSIEYMLEGCDDAKITAKQIGQMISTGNTSKLPKNVVELLSNILAISDPVAQYKEAVTEYRKAERALALINRNLWLHNASMYINGNKVHIHTHDANDWALNTETKVKTATVYKNSRIPKLMLKVTGISI